MTSFVIERQTVVASPLSWSVSHSTQPKHINSVFSNCLLRTAADEEQRPQLTSFIWQDQFPNCLIHQVCISGKLFPIAKEKSINSYVCPAQTILLP